MSQAASIAAQVKRNCNISDARYWGFYSPCGLLLRMRDLYKVENALQPWENVKNTAVMEWMGIREDLWNELEESSFQDIEINGQYCDPFDADLINGIIGGQGLFYSAGYGTALKPVFVLGELTDHSIRGACRIFRINKELARDLSSSPAMLQGRTVIARQASMAQFLWGKYEEMRVRKCRGSLHQAFAEYGIYPDSDLHAVQTKFQEMVQEELEPVICHELGEASQSGDLEDWWKDLLVKVSQSRAEVFVRAVKDVLSDTCDSGTLSFIIEQQRSASLSFYVSFLNGYRKLIFSSMVHAYGEFMRTKAWSVIERARLHGLRNAQNYLYKIKKTAGRRRGVREAIEGEIIPGH